MSEPVAIPTTISADEFEQWLTPRQVYKLLGPQWSYDVIRSTLLRMLVHRMLYARAGTLKIMQYDHADQTHHQALVPKEAWDSNSPSEHSHFWDNGLFDFPIGEGYSAREFSCFDVRFDPEVIHRLVETPAGPRLRHATVPVPAPEREPVNRGGRPRNEYWEPLLIEMARQLYEGELLPNRQADVENAMHDWLAANGHKGGETQVRQRARSLWEAIEK